MKSSGLIWDLNMLCTKYSRWHRWTARYYSWEKQARAKTWLPIRFIIHPPAARARLQESEETDDLDEVISRHIRRVLSMTKGKVNGPDGAAFFLGINPSTLRNRMKKLGIDYGRKSKSWPSGYKRWRCDQLNLSNWLIEKPFEPFSWMYPPLFINITAR